MGMLNQPNAGGTPGWKAMRGTCPVCRRDVALSPNRGPADGNFTVKAHGPVRDRCSGTGRPVRYEDARAPVAR